MENLEDKENDWLETDWLEVPTVNMEDVKSNFCLIYLIEHPPLPRIPEVKFVFLISFIMLFII